MQPQQQRGKEGAFFPLPIELFLNVLDQLVATRDGRQPVARAPSDPVTKALRAMTVVSRDIYPVASRYLYTHCLYLNSSTLYARFRRTLGLPLGYHPQALEYGQAGRNEDLFAQAEIPKHITSLFLSPDTTEMYRQPPRVRLPQIIDLSNTIGPTLKRLVMDLLPVYAPASEVERTKPHMFGNNIFGAMHNLEELTISYDTTDYFPYPPPHLKRLAVTHQGTDDTLLRFIFGKPTLEVVMILRDPEMDAMDIEHIFDSAPVRRKVPVQFVFVAVSADHRTPEGTRNWGKDDPVTMWEVDVPRSYYGDEDDLVLCDNWIWQHAVDGTLFKQQKRKMKSWSQAKKENEASDTTMDDA